MKKKWIKGEIKCNVITIIILNRRQRYRQLRKTFSEVC